MDEVKLCLVMNATRMETYSYTNSTPVLKTLYTVKYTYDADGDIIADENYGGTSDADLKLEGKNAYKYTIK